MPLRGAPSDRVNQLRQEYRSVQIGSVESFEIPARPSGLDSLPVSPRFSRRNERIGSITSEITTRTTGTMQWSAATTCPKLQCCLCIILMLFGAAFVILVCAYMMTYAGRTNAIVIAEGIQSSPSTLSGFSSFQSTAHL